MGKLLRIIGFKLIFKGISLIKKSLINRNKTIYLKALSNKITHKQQ